MPHTIHTLFYIHTYIHAQNQTCSWCPTVKASGCSASGWPGFVCMYACMVNVFNAEETNNRTMETVKIEQRPIKD